MIRKNQSPMSLSFTPRLVVLKIRKFSSRRLTPIVKKEACRTALLGHQRSSLRLQPELFPNLGSQSRLPSYTFTLCSIQPQKPSATMAEPPAKRPRRDRSRSRGKAPRDPDHNRERGTRDRSRDREYSRRDRDRSRSRERHRSARGMPCVRYSCTWARLTRTQQMHRPQDQNGPAAHAPLDETAKVRLHELAPLHGRSVNETTTRPLYPPPLRRNALIPPKRPQHPTRSPQTPQRWRSTPQPKMQKMWHYRR